MTTGPTELPRRRELRSWRERKARRARRTRTIVGISTLVALGALAAVAGPALRDDTGAVTLAGLPTRIAQVVDRSPSSSRGASRTPAPEILAPGPTGTGPTATGPTATAVPSEASSPSATPEPAASSRAPAASPAPASTPTPASTPVGAAAEEFSAALVALTNEQRTAAGLATLAVSPCATEQAVQRAGVLVAEDRFEHDPLAPVQAACGGRAAGENLALGHPTPADMTAGWMGSTGHRENILRASYTSIGIGCAEGSRGMLCAQVFLG
ncbi:CAP domain-containing protein [Cellulomonas sp. P22]|uniref:CAP domain-containing protein n=1 Tax=Cellulomonas sp. P22 TaxID=3373189 RepID=UPI00379AC9C8